ncbi:serine hydrolase domain-containing protein [Sphingomicrobium flavum]|uniref:serine hydrolase domain-containing protein n=1 Tax=Sphingomicrobium flavum TaxID=1229164 RepID=UPI0021AD8301|nr:serine hydrolase domain-containing protein [Sphingomicrobium flavum]
MNSSLLAIAAVSLSTAAHAEPVENLAAKVDAYLDAAYPDAGPGVAAVIVDDGEIVYHGAQGMADVAAGEALTKDSVFRIGSITKQFAAAAVMKLVDQGKVSLDDPLTRFVRDYPNGDAITVRMLLNHSSGVKSYTGIEGWMVESNTDKLYSTDELVAEFKDQPADFAPGQAFLYNNSGYILVGAVIEAATGKPWHQYVREELLLPAGIGNIHYMAAEDDTPLMVNGYTDFGGHQILSQKIDGSVPHAAGALIGDVAALSQWYDALFDGRIVSAASLEAMTQPTTTLDGQTTPYGFGLGVNDQRNRKAIGHSGGIFGFSTDSVYFPEENLFVAVFANSDSPAIGASAVKQRLSALALGDDVPLFESRPLDPAALEGALGRYRFDDDNYRDLYLEEGKLMSRIKDGSPLEAHYAGDNVYHYGLTTMSWFRIDRSGEAPRTLVYLNGSSEPLIGTYVGDIPEDVAIDLTDAQMSRLVGNYSFAFGAMVIARDGDGLTAKLGAQPAFALTARSESEFMVEQVGARILFTIDGDKATSLTVYQGGQEFTGPRAEH